MKIGVSAFAWTGEFKPKYFDRISWVRELGFQGMEIPMFQPSDLDVPEIRTRFETAGLECTVCAILPPGINPIAPERGIRQRSIEHLIRCIKATQSLGARLLCGPLYAPIGYLPPHRPTKDEWQWAVEAFQSICETLDRCNVDLAIEPVNRSETFFLRTAREAVSLCQAVGHPRLGVTIDTFHANIEERNVAGALTALGPLLKHVHASENDRGLLGRGHVDFKAIVTALNEIHYRGYLMIEAFGYDPEEVSAPGTLWADKSVSPESVVLEGMAFWKKLIASDAPHR